MKKTLTFFFCAAAVCGVQAANPDITVSSQVLDHGVIYPGICEIDINGDGILDVIYSGEVRTPSVAGRIVEDADGNETQINNNTFQMVWNPATQKYDISEFPYYFANKAYFAVADWNGDGLSDFYVAGEASMGLHGVEFGLFINNGDGTFARKQITVVDEEGNEITPFDPRTVDVADFNSDGRLDMVVTGWKADADNVRRNYNMVLINQGNDRFVATNTTLLMYGENPYELALNLTVAADLNNDGFADFLTQGNIDNADEGDKPVKNGKVMGRTFVAALNLGADGLADGVPVLYDLGLADGVSHHYGHGGFEVCDFNNDGVPDILVGGETPGDGRGDGEWAYLWQLLQGRITSDGVQYTDVTSSQAFNDKDIRPLNDTKPIRAIDYNGNGLYDLFMPGWSVAPLDGAGDTQAGWFFTNEGGTLSGFQHIPGSSECGVLFTEDGVSGARNYAFLGQSWDGKFFNDESDIVTGRMMLMTKNPYEKTARPDAPEAPAATVSDDGYGVTLEWSAAASSQNNVTYDYYIKDAVSGKYYRGVTAYVGGDKDGVRTTIAQGRAFMAKRLELSGLPDGDYEWGVQTVNAAYVGSAFAKGSNFRIGKGSSVSTAVATSPVVSTIYYDTMGRRLNAVPESGVVIKKEVRQDGTSTTSKIIL